MSRNFTVRWRKKTNGRPAPSIWTIGQSLYSRRASGRDRLKSAAGSSRKVIGSSLDSISEVTEEVAELLTRGRPLLKKDVAQLRRLFTILAKPHNKKYLDETLDILQGMLSHHTRRGVFGSWYNYYLCEFQGGVVLPSELMNLLPPNVQQSISNFTVHSSAERCQA